MSGAREVTGTEPAGPDRDQRVTGSQDVPDAMPTAGRPRKYGTFEGVFTPTLLTILGVIMYLRTGWVVGNAGFLGGTLIILLAFGITIATGLSMSAVATNIRIGAGGAYSMISKSLGLEVGGAIGIPLYLAQALAVSLYVFGFREGWLSIFPGHPALLVDLLTFAVLVGVASVSAGLAFRVQFGIMALIVASLVSVAVAAFQGSMTEPLTFLGEFPGAPEDNFTPTSFWPVFAVFFPAATGIMAGANLSGDLEDPRRAIPIGTLSAIGVSLVIYLALAYWLARSATPDELVANYTIMVERAAWGPAVLAGLLGATFSSALASIVGAPRILQALGDHGILPRGEQLARTTPRGEPRNAMVVTAVLVLGALLLRDLNAVAPLITMSFLITYGMINVVVLIEQSLGLVSFRPLLSLPRVVPLAGTVGCVLAMFIVNPVFGVVSVVTVVAFYGYLVRRRLSAPYGDVRSGLFTAVAEWAAERSMRLRTTEERAWKANLLIPVQDSRDLRGTFELIRDLARPKGSVKLLGFGASEGDQDLAGRLGRTAAAFTDQGVFATSTLVEADRVDQGVLTAMSALAGSFFRPNILFLRLARDPVQDLPLSRLVRLAPAHGLGVVVFADHPRAMLGHRQWINLWLRNPDWELGHEVAEIDLAVLLAYKLRRSWGGRIRLMTACADEAEAERARVDLTRLMDLARIPDAEIHAIVGSLEEALKQAPQDDVSIFGLPEEPQQAWMRTTVDRTGSACLFVRGSGAENALV